MGSHTNDGNGNIVITATGNYNVPGYITSVSVQSQPILFLLGGKIANLFANTNLRLRVDVGGGASTILEVNMLDFLGNGANMTVSDGNDSVSMFISSQSLQQDNPDFPFPSNTTGTFTISFTDWEYNNTSAGTTPLLSYSITQNVHKKALATNGVMSVAEIEAPDSFFIYNSDLPSRYEGSLLALSEEVNVTVTINAEDIDYTLRQLCEYGYHILTDDPRDFSNLGLDVENETQSANTFFKHATPQSETNTITFTIPCFNTQTNTDYDLVVSFSLNLAGITSGSVGMVDFEEGQYGIISSRLRFSNGGTTPIDLPSSMENYYSSVFYTYYNLDTEESETDVLSDLPNGHHKITLNVRINPQYTMTFENTFVVYEEEVSTIEATLIQEQFRVGSVFSDSNISVMGKHLIYGDEFYDIPIYYPDFTSDYNNHRFTQSDMPSVEITVTYGALTTTVTAQVYNYEFDELWVYNKDTLQRTIYGEIQQNYNMNFVIDETKDNAKVVVYNHIRQEIEPNTICYHASTDTWWICKSDRVTRYDSEVNALYKHEVSLLGAIELLNARELVNCGFNANRYAIGSFLTRLIELSNLEMPVVFNLGLYMSIHPIIDYLKTFANYTPLSALKEFFNGYNMSIKMLFETENGGGKITRGIIYLIPKNGIDNQPIDIDTFDDSEELITSDRESFGSRVLSNVQNCVSGKVVRYPATGTCKIGSSEDKVLYENALIRLPSKANRVDMLEICGRYSLMVEIIDIQGQDTKRVYKRSNTDIYDENEFTRTFDNVTSQIGTISGIPSDIIDLAYNLFTSKKDEIYNSCKRNTIIKLENGADYDITTQQWNGKQVKLAYRGSLSQQTDGHPGIGDNRSNSIGLNDKQHYDSFPTKPCIIYWEQGSDLIKNFTFYDNFIRNQNGRTWRVDTSVDGRDIIIEERRYIGADQYIIRVSVYYGNADANYGAGVGLMNDFQATYVVHYVPMADIRLKVENGSLHNDTVLYNQNGTLIGAKAVSKLINSHAKSISSNEITRYKRYYDFFSIPSVGQLVNNNDVLYVINNVSIDFVENDNNQYALDCVFTMTKQIACKSTMISANTNIRDYETPQKNNIVRQQNYRDYFEFSYISQLAHRESLWYSPTYLTRFAQSYVPFANKGFIDTHTAMVRVVSGSNNWYYQVPSTKYELDKMVVEVFDFKDNNIIAYGTQQTTHPFQFSKWWVQNDLANVPISYTNEFGELDSIILRVVDNEQLTSGYNYIQTNYQSTANMPSLYATAGLIPQELYNYFSTSSSRDMLISEENYKKDGLEIPVFVYSCQIGEKNNITVGSDFFEAESCDENHFFAYYYKIVDENNITEEKAMTILGDNELPTMSGNRIYNANELYVSTDNEYQYTFELWHNSIVDLTTTSRTQGEMLSGSLKNKTIIIYRCLCDNEKVISTKFVMALNKYPLYNFSGTITLYKNYYKLK